MAWSAVVDERTRSFLQQEPDQRIRALWELHLNMEVTQLQNACDLLRRYEGREPAEIGLPVDLPDPVTFEPNKDYVRQILATQLDLTTDRTEYGFAPPARYEQYQTMVNGKDVPTEDVINLHREQFGQEYRSETEGPHPAERLREPQPAS